MRHGLGNSQRLESGLAIDPRLMLASQLLQLSQMELEQAIEAELAENPALERLQDETEPVTEQEILKSIAPDELKPSGEDHEFCRSLPNDEPGMDWLDFAPAPPSLRDHLAVQLLPMLPPQYRELGLYLIECLDGNGYLQEPSEEIALATERTIEEVDAVVNALQRCEPTGVGARDVKECLLIQLRDAQTLEQRLARAIIRSYLDEFSARQTLRLARRFKVMPEVVEQSFLEILRLNPFPAEGFGHDYTLVAPRRHQAVPDLVLTRDDSGWTVTVNGSTASALSVSRAYRRRKHELEKQPSAPRDEKRHVGHFVQRATDFLACLEQRRKTLRKIGEYLIEFQPGFIATGQYQFLRPLTRSKIAQDVGLHESTVSRATSDKFVQIANGEVVSFDVFFKPALRVQKMIEDILATENPNDPFTDERIAEMLAERGVEVARRTVNKYRDRTRLLSSRRRRSA